jgi:hypothetical protein
MWQEDLVREMSAWSEIHMTATSGVIDGDRMKNCRTTGHPDKQFLYHLFIGPE